MSLRRQNEVLPITSALNGVPQTMLWTLYNRASESLRQDAWFRDPDAERIYRAIPFDYRAHFGRPDSSHATRSQMFDEALRSWLSRHPDGTVIELGCGLETQFQRCDNGRLQWLCVDVAEALDVRERFLPPAPRCRHLRLSVLDRAWLDGVAPSASVFISAQGLLMYFQPEEVRMLLCDIARRLPGAELMFDTIPRWFSTLTLRGLKLTAHYQAPPMPWGLDRHEIEPVLRDWIPGALSITHETYRRFRGFPACLAPSFARIPWLGRFQPAVVRLLLPAR